MLGVMTRWGLGCVLAWLVLAGSPAQAQQAAYKCWSRGSVTYSGVPCPGGRRVGEKAPRSTDKAKAPPQDRAKIAKRATLTPEERQECRALDGRLVEQQQGLQARGEAVTLQDEMPLVQSKKRFRELKC